MIDELSIIAHYFRPLAGEGAFEFRDDAGRLQVPPGRELVVTADMICAGVHFLPDDPPRTIAQKALRVNISDLAAKAAEPLAYTLSAAFPFDLQESWLAEFCEGLRLDQQEFGIGLLGGDTVSMRVGAPVLSVTAFGTTPAGAMVHRFSARPGDAIYVSGTIGRSAAGLALLQARPGPWDSLPDAERAALVDAYRAPQPRVGLIPALRACARAAMDVSDGLIGDCDKLAMSSGCTAVIDVERVPVPSGLGQDLTSMGALITGGDDYEILAAIPPERERAFVEAADSARLRVSHIGHLRAHPGLTEVLMNARPMDLQERAYVHGRE